MEHWEDAARKNIGLLLFGDVGTGKSFLAGCIANALLEQDVPVLMTNFPTILNRMTGLFGSDRADFLADLNAYDLLILDDLGAERGTEYALEQVFAVIDARYRSRKPLIVTTNLTLMRSSTQTIFHMPVSMTGSWKSAPRFCLAAKTCAWKKQMK